MIDLRHHRLLRALTAGGLLAGIATLCVLAINFAHDRTEDRIAAQHQENLQALVGFLLPEEVDPATSRLSCALITHPLIGKRLPFYTVRNAEGAVTGYISIYSSREGYSNPLLLIAGLDAGRRLHRIDVYLSHETPGIGDRIERRRGNFLDQFSGRDLADDWEFKSAGGDFDSLTGATVSSRAVMRATHDLLVVMRDLDPHSLPPCPRQP